MSVENLQNYKALDSLEKRLSNIEKNIANNNEIEKNIANNNEIKKTLKEIKNAMTFMTVILYGESKLTSKTDNEKTAVVNAIVKDINFINPLIND